MAYSKPSGLDEIVEYVQSQFKIKRLAGDPKAIAMVVHDMGCKIDWVWKCRTWGVFADSCIARHEKEAKAASGSDTGRSKGVAHGITVCGLCWRPLDAHNEARKRNGVEKVDECQCIHHTDPSGGPSGDGGKSYLFFRACQPLYFIGLHAEKDKASPFDIQAAIRREQDRVLRVAGHDYERRTQPWFDHISKKQERAA